MPRANSHHQRRPGVRNGVSLAEAVISMALVGVLLVAALGAVGTSARHASGIDDTVRGQRLAADMLNEILQLAYAEPGGATGLGTDAGENTGNRSLFDDVDDYAGWTSSPPNDRSGAALPGFTGWTRDVAVVWANPATFAPSPSINTGLKRITVTVSKNGTAVATLMGYRSIAWVDTIPAPSDATGNRAPVAVATSPGLIKTTLQTVSFYGSSSSDPDGDYLSYVWNFGNGVTDTGMNTSHRYSSPGNYTCTLTVYDGRGGVGTATLIVTITL